LPFTLKHIKHFEDLKERLLIAAELATEEIIISEFQKKGNKVNFIERIDRKENKLLFNAVVTPNKNCKFCQY
jgi:hypothetical protein